MSKLKDTRYRQFISMISRMADPNNELPNQSEVSKVLGISASSLNNYVGNARKRGEWIYHFSYGMKSSGPENTSQQIQKDIERVKLARRLKTERCGGHINDEDIN